MKLNEEAPKCIVLLATFNGEKFLDEQIRSIQMQIGVKSKIYFSDDCSSDNSSEICAKHGCINLNPNRMKFGSAAMNFFHLIDNIELADSVEYIFLSDQDDIWKPNKMISAIKALRETRAVAYSGSYDTCDFDGNSMRYVNKSFKQTDVDYFFRSPGPGFTFCFSRYAFEQIEKTLEHTEAKKDIRWHDWFIYAQARIMNLEWYIDNRAFALYRIHDHNDTGQISSVKQLMKRFKFLMNGSYRRQVLLMTIGSLHPLRHHVIRFNFLDKLRLITLVHRMRSKVFDRFALILWALFSKKD
jgi:rhamnosyltransferase